MKFQHAASEIFISKLYASYYMNSKYKVYKFLKFEKYIETLISSIFSDISTYRLTPSVEAPTLFRI